MSGEGERTLRSRDRDQFSSFVRSMEDSDSSPSEYQVNSGQLAKRGSAEKRKLNDQLITVHTTPKRKRIFGPEQIEEYQDVYCWECHRPCVDGCLDCTTCPRTFHPRCLNLTALPSSGNYSCPPCTQVMNAEMADSRSWAMQMISVDKLSTLLLSALQRMKHPDSEPFLHPVPRHELADYYDVVFHPMDLSLLERNVKKKIYASTEAFLEDAKWIMHNCVIYNGSTSKFTIDARLIIKICKHEMNEIEICPECYSNSSLRKDNWFTEPCTFPHCLVWAKLKGFPFWPAKALRISGSNNVDVRFFGAHDRSWIPLSQCYLLSQECPVMVKSTKKYGLDQAMAELETHLNRIREKFGTFTYAPPRTEFSPNHLINCQILFGYDIATKVPNYSGRKLGNTSTLDNAGGADDSIDAESNLDLRLHLNEEEDMSPDRHGGSESHNSSVGDGDGSLSESGKQPSVPQPIATNASRLAAELKDVHTEESQDSIDQHDDYHHQEGVFTVAEADNDPHENESIGDRSFTVAEIEEKLRVTEARLRQSVEANGQRSQDDSDDDADMDDMPSERELSGATAKFVLPLRGVASAGSSGSPANTTLSPSEIRRTTSAAQAKAQALKKRSLNSCLQKLHQKTDKPQSPLVSEDRAADTPGPSETDAPAVGGSGTGAMGSDNKSALFRRFSQKISQFVMGTFSEMLAEISPIGGQSSGETPNSSSEMKSLRHELNRMAWIQKQAISEMQHQAKLTIAEMQELFNSDKQRFFEEQKRKFEEEKQRAIAETKQKQWCANCGREAMFYCCWNTSYCDYPCQQHHWSKHQENCAQMRQPQQAASEVPPAYTIQQPGSAPLQAQVHYVQGPAGLVPVYTNPQSAGAIRPAAHTIVAVSTAQGQPGNHLYPAMQPRPNGTPGIPQVIRRR